MTSETSPEIFRLPLPRYYRIEVYYTRIGHPTTNDGRTLRHMRERQAVMRLLRHACGPDTELHHTPEGAPYVSEYGVYSVSVSHSRELAAIALSREPGIIVGVDVEEWRDQLPRVAPRVLDAAELEHYGKSDAGLIAVWTLKEALFKASLRPGTDFRDNIHLPLDFTPVENRQGEMKIPHARAKVDGCGECEVFYCNVLPESRYTWMSLVVRRR